MEDAMIMESAVVIQTFVVTNVTNVAQDMIIIQLATNVQMSITATLIAKSALARNMPRTMNVMSTLENVLVLKMLVEMNAMNLVMNSAQIQIQIVLLIQKMVKSALSQFLIANVTKMDQRLLYVTRKLVNALVIKM